jgi:hypothetical protein
MGAPACPGAPWGLALETWDPLNECFMDTLDATTGYGQFPCQRLVYRRLSARSDLCRTVVITFPKRDVTTTDQFMHLP